MERFRNHAAFVQIHIYSEHQFHQSNTKQLEQLSQVRLRVSEGGWSLSQLSKGKIGIIDYTSQQGQQRDKHNTVTSTPTTRF